LDLFRISNFEFRILFFYTLFYKIAEVSEFLRIIREGIFFENIRGNTFAFLCMFVQYPFYTGRQMFLLSDVINSGDLRRDTVFNFLRIQVVVTAPFIV